LQQPPPFDEKFDICRLTESPQELTTEPIGLR